MPTTHHHSPSPGAAAPRALRWACGLSRHRCAVGTALVVCTLLLLGAAWHVPCQCSSSSSKHINRSSSSNCSSSHPSSRTDSSDLNKSSRPASSRGSRIHKQPASIVVIVPVKADSHQRRGWQRAQWARNIALLRQQDPAAADGAVFKFVVGLQGLSGAHATLARGEQQQHGDMLLLPHTIDTNVPDPPPEGTDTATVLKVIAGATWATKHYTFPWFVRLGDDSYYRVDYFLTAVAHTLQPRRLILGYAEDPQLGWRWGNTAELKRYCSGMGFVMTPDVVQYISDNADLLYKGYPEDAVVGLWFAGTTVRVQHDTRFHDWEWKRCSRESIIIHKHPYTAVDEDGVMRSCFPEPPVAAPVAAAVGTRHRAQRPLALPPPAARVPGGDVPSH